MKASNMKNLQNYKIETNGLNEPILHKAVELGYFSWTMRNAKYLFLYDDGVITTSNHETWFKDHEHTEISAHDFLRLNWEPKVGERVESTFPRDESKRGIIDDIEIDDLRIKFNDGESDWYHRDWIIPSYPKKEQPKEKPDAYILDSAKLSDGSWVLYLIVREGDENIKSRIYAENAYKYNLLSESDYKAKYLDKLMFKNWEVEGSCSRIKIGDLRLPYASVRYIYRSVKYSNLTPADLKNITLYDVYEFMNINEEKLGL